ncbi:autophagy protein 16-domain-containing protein [Lentinula raphanica]|nr:autophagy protein 16-domain-containing protein [Lentinula raphanica]
MRDELAGVYKTQGQNTQRLLAMTETLREKEELSRVDAEALRKSKDELMILRRKVEQHNELMTEKDRTVQILHDEISTLQLELGQIEERNATLTKDNAKLLQRWLDAKQSEANKMNEANEFYEDMRSKHQAVLNWRDGSAAGDTTASSNTGGHGSVSGNGEARDPDLSAETKDGILSTTQKRVDQTQNG